MAPGPNQMSFKKIKELILEAVNMADNTTFISVKDIIKSVIAGSFITKVKTSVVPSEADCFCR